MFRVTIKEEVIQNASKWLETERIIITAVGPLATGRRERKKKITSSFQFSVCTSPQCMFNRFISPPALCRLGFNRKMSNAPVETDWGEGVGRLPCLGGEHA